MSSQRIRVYIEENGQRFVEDLRMLLRQPSVSAQGRGLVECAHLIRDMASSAGIDAKVIPVEEGNPVVYGEVKSRASAKTLLVYGHYDVQPPEPLGEWVSDPFAAEMKDGRIIARGAADSKGNVVAQIKAVEVLLKTIGDVPLNLKFIFEGEEEIASPHLPQFVMEHRDMLKADAVVCFDGGADESGRPEINLGLKGILYVELRCKGAAGDLHSSRAPIVPNPAWRLIWALNTIKGRDEKIAVEGWYDDVRSPTSHELELLRDIPFSEEKRKQEYGLKEFLRGLEGLDALRALVYEPTCTVCGFEAGYTGPGSKTVLPSKAFVKLDFRLAYDQDPHRLFDKLKLHLERHGFDDLEVLKLGALEPSKTPPTAPIARAVREAAEEVYGMKPVIYPNNPASGPDYLFTKRLGLNSVWTGCAPPFSNAHAPNEFTTEESFLKGVEYAAKIVENFAKG